MSQQQQTNETILLECLNGLLSPDLHKLAEQKLTELSTTMPFYGLMLCQLATNNNANIDIRQLSLIVLKKFIKEHWHEMNSPQEKEQIKSLLTPSISDPSSKIRTAIAIYEKTLTDLDVESAVFESVVISLIEFLTLIVSKKNKAMFQAQLPQIISITLTFLQMSDDSADLYQSDPSQFLEQDDETSYTPRSLASGLLASLGDVYKGDVLGLVYQALQSFSSSWRQSEASLLAMSVLSSHYINAGNKKYFDFAQFLERLYSFFSDANSTGEHSDILQGRALHCACLYSSGVDKSISLPFLKLSVNILHQANQPLPNKIAAMKAVAAFNLSSHLEFIPTIIQASVNLLLKVTEDCLLVVLDAILLALRADTSVDHANYEPIIVPPLLQTWTQYANDPMACEAMNDIFQILCKSQGCYPAIIDHVLPTLCLVIENFDKPAYLGVADRAVSLLNLILSNCKSNFDAPIFDKILAPLINILLSNVNTAEPVEKNLITATLTILPIFIVRGHQQLGQWTYREEVVAHLSTRQVLESVLNEWTKFHGDIQNRLDTNISTIALGKLMCLNDERVAKILVDGTLMVPPQLKKTRSQSRNSFMSGGAIPEKWTKAPFYQKATMVILETYEMEILDQQQKINDIDKKLLSNDDGDENQDDQEYDDDDGEYDDDDDDFDVDNCEFEPAEDYFDLIGDDDDINLEDDFDPLAKEDPYYNINLVDCIKDIFKTFNNSNPLLFKESILPIIKNKTPQLLN
ncbi:importin 9 [Heterostelium album PN500]|uniref:Importin 9 n=1 Tax=Heterostelium pallidum (strain ATCC 26659 / Pp 5 / PN500) TaxID=670386 RepID=D3BUL6_HETP5|nr:importin 9 [Heterostelium album PN500]EFA74804.1 importin 9 [Heterostelium album PN500]|eukprot:XP_020426938.1 importin 9 [Heterostelium album PN500]